MGDAQKSYKKLMCEEWSEYPGTANDREKTDEAVNFLGFVLVKAVSLSPSPIPVLSLRSRKSVLFFFFFQFIDLKERIYSGQPDKVCSLAPFSTVGAWLKSIPGPDILTISIP